MKRIAIPVVILIALAALLVGCGGGGGGRELAISGTVTDVAGNLVPGADIFLDGRKVTTSLMNGTFKFNLAAAGFHNIEADATIDNKVWAGTRAVEVFADGPTQNQNIVIGNWDELGDIEGSVTNSSNDPIGNARVIAVARYPQDRPADEASVISKVVVTDRNGDYTLDNLPASITVQGVKQPIIYDVIASSAGLSGQPRGFENVTKTATVGAGQVTRLDFTLVSSSTVIPTVPPGWTDAGAIYVISYTIPTSITSRATLSAYDAVKSCISQRSAKAIALKRKVTSRMAPPGTLIENDVVWYSIWNSHFGIDVPSNLAGFSIYRATNRSPQQSGQFQIDFVRDPAIVSYADASSLLTAGTTYSYGVSAVSTSYLDANNQFNPNSESEMSHTASVTPLDRLIALQPMDRTTVDVPNPVFTWSRVTGARSYRVFIYEAYPILDSLFTPQGDPERPDHLPAWGQSSQTTGTSVTFSDPDFPLVAGHTYWWVVMAADSTTFDNGFAYSISELRSFVAR